MNPANQLFVRLTMAAAQADQNLDAAPIVPKLLADRTLKDGLTWGEITQFIAVGLLIVFATLTTLWLICELMGLFFKRLDAKNQEKIAADAASQALSAAPLAPSIVPPALEEEIHPAVFVAAANAIMGSTPHRVVSVQKLAPGTPLPTMSQDIPLAAIAAAVAHVLGQTPHRILSVRPIDTSWAQEGRREQLSPYSRS